VANLNVSEQVEKAERLRALHRGERILVLPNIWNPGGARSGC
jgi:2-methylisocitrate lyase-like PEP mutase family enzyme